MTTNDNKKLAKISNLFYCENCCYSTHKKFNLEIHLLSAKHIKTTNNNTKLAKTSTHHKCENCEKIFNDRVGLWRHKKKCIQESKNTNIDVNNEKDDINITPELIINIIQQNTGIIQLSENANKFYDKWLGDLEYINTTMRSIRRIQVDCTLLDLCANNNDIMEKEYDGYLFDKILRNDGLFQFMVFLPELKLSSRITLRDNIDNFENKKFKLFLFNDEASFKKKIRLHLL